MRQRRPCHRRLTHKPHAISAHALHSLNPPTYPVSHPHAAHPPSLTKVHDLNLLHARGRGRDATSVRQEIWVSLGPGPVLCATR